MNPSEKAEVANLKVMLRAIEKGASVSKPIVEGTRYDLIVDHLGKLYRAQVKYTASHQKNGVVAVRLHSGSYGKTRFRCYTAREIDVVLAYVPKLDAVLWIEPECFEGKTGLNFRSGETGRKHIQGCRNAEDYIW